MEPPLFRSRNGNAALNQIRERHKRTQQRSTISLTTDFREPFERNAGLERRCRCRHFGLAQCGAQRHPDIQETVEGGAHGGNDVPIVDVLRLTLERQEHQRSSRNARYTRRIDDQLDVEARLRIETRERVGVLSDERERL